MKHRDLCHYWLARLRSVVRRILSPWSSLCARLPFQNLQVEVVQRKAFARPSFKICELKMWKRSFRASFLQNMQVEVVQWKLSCETSFKICKLKMWKRSFRGRLQTSKTALCRGRFFAAIALLQSLFSCSHLSLRSFLFAVIVLCSHCALPSLCFAVMVLWGHGPLQCWKRMHQGHQQKDFLKVGNIVMRQ